MSNQVQRAQQVARQAEAAQVAAWKRWQADETAESQSAWEAAVDAQRAAEAAVDRAEVWADRREAMESRQSDQADWWVAAVSNARAA